ncbi:MAG: hypothetical protein HZA54_04965 [Planctomycetes bacterium]|nr:hypothetical protein [Planctomycetota bacterium]
MFRPRRTGCPLAAGRGAWVLVLALAALCPPTPLDAAPPADSLEPARPRGARRIALAIGAPLELDPLLPFAFLGPAQDVVLRAPAPATLPARTAEMIAALAALTGTDPDLLRLAGRDLDLALRGWTAIALAAPESPRSPFFADLAARAEVGPNGVALALRPDFRVLGERRQVTPWDKQQTRRGEYPSTLYEAGASWTFLKDFQLESRWGAEIDTDNTDFVGTTSVGLKF